MNIGLAIIAKNAESTLARCVESARSIVDQVVVGVDTTSTDKTLDVARQVADEVYEFHMEPTYVSPEEASTGQFVNFAKARNDCVARLETDWAFVLDADEQLVDERDILPQLLDRDLEGIDAFAFIVQMDQPDGNVRGLHIRLWRLNAGIDWFGEVHNELRGVTHAAAIKPEDGVLIRHLRTEDRKHERDPQRSASIYRYFESVLREDPANCRALFYLGAQHSSDGHYLQALELYRRYLDHSDYGAERARVRWNAAFAYRQLGLEDHAREQAFLALDDRFDAAESLCTIGDIAAHQARRMAKQLALVELNESEERLWLDEIDHKIREAEHYFSLAAETPLPLSPIFSPYDFYTWLPLRELCQLYAEVERPDKVAEVAERLIGIEYCPDAIRQEALQAMGQAGDLMLRGAAMPRRGDHPHLVIVDQSLAWHDGERASFTDDLMAGLQDEGWHVDRVPRFDARYMVNYDVAWMEWCDQNVIEAASTSWDVPVICRLHSYEAFAGYPEHVDWSNVKRLVCVSEHLADYVKQRYHPNVAIEVIHNGVDLSRWTYRDRERNGKIAWAGYINHKKGIQLLAEIMAMHTEMEFHLAGEVQDPDLWAYLKYVTHDLGNMTWHGKVPREAMDEWLDDKAFLLSTSVTESFGYTIAEAMAKGIKPLVRDRPGASTLWPSSCVFRTMADVGRLLNFDYDSARYREWVAERYDLSDQVASFNRLLLDVSQRDRVMACAG